MALIDNNIYYNIIMNSIIIYTLIFYGLSHYIYINKCISHLYTNKKLYTIKEDPELESEPETEPEPEPELESEPGLELESGLEKESKPGLVRGKLINLLNRLINQVESGQYNDNYIDHHCGFLNELLSEMKGISFNDTYKKYNNQQNMRRLFLVWKKITDKDKDIEIEPKINKYGSYENLTLELDL